MNQRLTMFSNTLKEQKTNISILEIFSLEKIWKSPNSVYFLELILRLSPIFPFPETLVVRSFRSCQDKENRVAVDRRGGSKIIRSDPDRAGKSGPPGDESPLRGQDRPPPGRGIGIPEAVRKRQRGDEPLQQEQSTVDRVGGQQRWARLVEQHRGPASGLLQKLQRSGRASGCPLDGVLGPGADHHQRNQLKSGQCSSERTRRITRVWCV